MPYHGGAAPAQEGESGPGFLTGPNEGDPEDIAIDYLQDASTDFGVASADVSDLAVRSAPVSEHSGVTHVNLYQRYKGMEVFGATATVNIAEDGSVVHVGHTLVSDLAEGASGSADHDAADAVGAAAEALDLDEPSGIRTLRAATGADAEVLLSTGGISESPIPAKLGWQPTDDGLRLAWQLVIDDSSDVDVWNATIDAETGELLNVDNWTIEHTQAQLASTLTRVPASHASSTTASTGTHRPANAVEDGSSYTVYEVPSESPNDGPRTTVTNPADADASPFGWHDTNGASGAEFTTTRGNNVHAYLDQDANNQPDPGQDVDGGPGLQFHFDVDLTEHAQDYREAVTANLFYMNNVIHDVMYGYGFDEVSGNFQANKYGATLPNGNPVPGGDYVRAEAADGNGTNNANFSTPANYGGTPRMQMFLWPGNQFGSQNIVTVGESTFSASWARFGPPAKNAPVGGQLVVAGNGCTADQYPAEPPAGFIAVVDGVTTAAGCANPVRTAMAESLGASAVIVASTGTGAAPILTGTQAAGPVGIPAVSVTQADGTAIKALAGQTGSVAKNPNHPGIRDGDFENGIIIHEYGHGISLRLTGGPGINCLSGNEQMGEGWSDYYAITMLLDPALDDPEVARGMGPYALFQDDRHGAGIRPRPYTRDMNVQPFTYDRIKTNSWITGGSLALPHGVGHAWAATLWDMNWNLIDRHGFNPNIYDDWSAGGNNLALQLVTDGLKMQGCGPGFVAGRDAIIAADLALADQAGTPDNNCLLWSTFARRGLGYSAEQGTTNRNDNTEAFDVPPWCKAPGAGFVGPLTANAPGLNTVDAGSVLPVMFNLGGNLGLDILLPNHSPSSQEISCETLEPLQFAITTPTNKPGKAGLTYNSARNRYQYLWETEESWAGTCRQLIVTLNDGTQHRAKFEFVAVEEE
jgi:hypothetical protein